MGVVREIILYGPRVLFKAGRLRVGVIYRDPEDSQLIQPFTVDLYLSDL